ncbi:MAG: hypothetical protein A2Y79_12060 [Deltaproteobacteria bacterium RBG_13_43_22]|nr:MAG: hypothetical protein A2Y79_12060 [Deltaproteobacteria bacterium RBG_13_43_22]
MENQFKTENEGSQTPRISSPITQRFKLSSLEILFGSLIIIGLIYMGYIILFQDNSGSVSKLEKKIKSLESISQEQGARIDKRIKAIQDNQAQWESRLKALETTNQGLIAKLGKMEPRKREERKPSPVSPGKGKIQHQVKRGETLLSIAVKYKVSLNDLLQWNKMNRNEPLRAGETLIIIPR